MFKFLPVFLLASGTALVVGLAASVSTAHTARSWDGMVRAAPGRDAPKVAAIVGSDDNSKPASSRQRCYLRVDGKVFIDGECSVFPLSGGTYTLNVIGRGKRPSRHFAQVTALAGGRFEATWNVDPADLHALDPLGPVEMKDGCWVNARVRICAGKGWR